jgi:hypothetical protein
MSTFGPSEVSKYFDLDSVDLEFSQIQKILLTAEFDLTNFIGDMSFSGFDKSRIARLAAKQLGPRLLLKLLVLAAMRGTNLKKILEKSMNPDPKIKEAFEKKKVLSGGKGKDDVTMGRILSCFPEVAAYKLMEYKLPAKIVTSTCPACIQFPAAAALPMSATVRAQHIKFCKDFSRLIKSKFEETYYLAAFNGGCDFRRVDGDLKAVLGNPTEASSRAVDLAPMFIDDQDGGVKI